jgi:hypothetical protein
MAIAPTETVQKTVQNHPGPPSPHAAARETEGIRSLAAKCYCFGGGLPLESAGGVAVPLIDESGGGVVEGLLWSEGALGAAESLGAAGAVAVESVLGGVGEVDSCLEQATAASALRHNNRTLRFMDHL